MRLKSEIWIKAYLRRCAVQGAPGYVVRRGDSDAGAVFVRINRLDGSSVLLVPAPAGLRDDFGERRFISRTPAYGRADADVEAMIEKTIAVDPDVWVIEIEDRDGRHFLDQEIDD